MRQIVAVLHQLCKRRALLLFSAADRPFSRLPNQSEINKLRHISNVTRRGRCCEETTPSPVSLCPAHPAHRHQNKSLGFWCRRSCRPGKTGSCVPWRLAARTPRCNIRVQLFAVFDHLRSPVCRSSCPACPFVGSDIKNPRRCDEVFLPPHRGAFRHALVCGLNSSSQRSARMLHCQNKRK